MSRFLAFLILVFFIGISSGQAQSERIQKIVLFKARLKEVSTAADRASILNQLVRACIQYELDSAIKYCEIARSLIEKNHIDNERGALYLNLAEISIFRDRRKETVFYLKKAESEYLRVGNIKYYLETMCYLAGTLMDLKKTDEAAAIMNEGVALAGRYNDPASKAFFLVQQGKLYFIQGNYAMAEKAYLQSIPIHISVGHKNPTAMFSELGNVYFHQGEYAKALDTYRQALPYLEKEDDYQGFGYIYSNIGKALLELGRTEEAFANFQDGLKAREKINYALGKAVAYTDLSWVSLDMESQEMARMYADKALEIVNSSPSYEKAAVLSVKARIYLETGFPDSALAVLKEADAIYHQIDHGPGKLASALDFERVAIVFGDQSMLDQYYALARAMSLKANNEAKLAEAVFLKALFLTRKGSYREAIDLLESGKIPYLRSPRITVEMLALLSDAYLNVADKDHSEAWMSKLSHFVDSLKYIGHAPSVALSSTKYALMFKEKELRSTSALLSRMSLLIAGLVLGVAVLAITGYYIRRRLLYKRKLLALTREKLKVLQEKEKSLLEGIRSEHKARVEDVSELVETVKTKNFFLAELKEMMHENYEERPASVRDDIRTMLSSIQHQLSADNSIDDIMLLEEEFLSRLKAKYPDLTKKEKRLCIYIRMNFSNQEIAGFSNVQSASVEKSKFRLKQKFGLAPKDDLKEFIKGL